MVAALEAVSFNDARPEPNALLASLAAVQFVCVDSVESVCVSKSACCTDSRLDASRNVSEAEEL
jgi:hypothetical protein